MLSMSIQMDARNSWSGPVATRLSTVSTSNGKRNEVLSETLRDRKVVLLKKPFSLATIIEEIGPALEVES